MKHSGGRVVAEEEEASILIADPNLSNFDRLVAKYQKDGDKHVESYTWVKQCVENEELEYTPVILHNKGGRKAGEK